MGHEVLGQDDGNLLNGADGKQREFESDTLLKMKCRTPAELALFRASVLRIKSAARNISEHFHCAKCRAEAQSCTFEPSILERGARNVRGSRAMTPIQ